MADPLPHVLSLIMGRTVDPVGHMCPECGNPPAPFCAWCYGAGVVSGDRLREWQRAKWAAAGG